MGTAEEKLLKRAIVICKLLGDADIESDDHGDRWIGFRSKEDENWWVEIRATYSVMEDDPLKSVPVWKINTNRIEYFVKRG